MLRLVLIYFFVALYSSAQIVDESSLVAKPKPRTTTKQKATSNPQSPEKKASSVKTSTTQKPVKTQIQPSASLKTKAAPSQHEKPSVPPPTQLPTPTQSPKAITTKPANEQNLKLTPVPNPTEDLPPLTEDDDIKSNTLAIENDRPRFKNRKAWTVDYNTWYEMLIIKNKTSSSYSESKSHYFGVGFYYDYTVYEEKFGYAGSLGFIAGNAQAGTINTGEYYERRISWMGYRAGGRVFVRANNRVDIGPGLIIQYKNTSWPEETNYKVMSQTNPQYFMYIDTRWRVSYPLELIQSFGVHTRQYALVWRLGINYTFN